MSEFFFQIVLFLAGAVIGVIAQILKPLYQKILAGALAILLIAAASFWLGYEFGASQSKTALATPIRPPSPATTPTTTQIPSTIFTPTSTPAKTTILSPVIPESPTVPASLFGTKYKVQMSTGITSPSKHQAIPIHLNFSNEDYGKNLCVYVDSYQHLIRVELWIGNIPKDNDHWWDSYQMAVQDPPGVPWKSKVNPKLTFPVIPGQYTLFLIRWLEEDSMPDLYIDYNISLLSGSCPQNRP